MNYDELSTDELRRLLLETVIGMRAEDAAAVFDGIMAARAAG